MRNEDARSWNHDRAHYRCKLPSEYALANKAHHPPTIYLREDHVVPVLDEWIAEVFDPENLDHTVASLAAAQSTKYEGSARAEAAQRQLNDVDDKIARLVAAIENGAPVDMVGPRLQQLRATKLDRAGLNLARLAATLSEASIRSLIAKVDPIADVLADAALDTKAKLYGELGLELTFHAKKRLVHVEALPVYLRSCRRGDHTREYTAGLRAWLVLAA